MLQITLLLLLFFSWSNALKLGPEGVYNIEWEVSGDKKVITFELTVRSLGYIGLGVSPNGTMVGADIAAVEIRENGSGELTDRYAIGHYTPTRDDENNLSLLSFKRNETSTYVKFSRPLVTGDSLHDQPIHEGETVFIWAYGDISMPKLTFHGFVTRGRFNLNVFKKQPKK